MPLRWKGGGGSISQLRSGRGRGKSEGSIDEAQVEFGGDSSREEQLRRACAAPRVHLPTLLALKRIIPAKLLLSASSG